MDTATIIIGNSDDKLTQQQWSEFVSDVQDVLTRWPYLIQFHGLSVGSAPWQNACWVLEIVPVESKAQELIYFRDELTRIAERYRQESIALILGDTEFVKGV